MKIQSLFTRSASNLALNLLIAFASIAVIARTADLYLGNRQDRSIKQELQLRGRNIQPAVLTHDKPLVLFFLSTQCPHCLNSSESYRKLMSDLRDLDPDYRFAASFPQSRQEVESYLKANGLDFELLDLAPSELGIVRTPTVSLVRRDGTVEEIWVGANPSLPQQILNKAKEL